MANTKRLIVLLCLAVCCILLLAACGGGSSSGSSGGSGGEALTFVAADKTNWDKALGIGDYSYNIAAVLNADGTITLTATCAGKGPSGEPGAGEDYSANDFTKTGTWTKEPGYGYEITIDGYTTKTDYDKASARQYIYVEIKNGDASSGLVQLLAKDPDFRNEMAADYDIFEARDAQYTFKANGTSGNGNATQTKVYLEKDGAANAVLQQGSGSSYNRGSWSENADKSLTVTLGANVLTADYCDIAGKEGYRLVYNGSTMYASVSGAEIDYTDKDFDGETIRTLSCAERDYTVELTEKGIAGIYNRSGTRVASGKYTEAGGTLTIEMAGTTFTSGADGNITLQFTVRTNNGPFGGTSTIERSFPIDGSMPEAASGEASGEASGDASGEAAGSEEATGEAPASEEAPASQEP